MTARMPIRILACALGLATLGSAAVLFSETASRAQPPRPDVPKGQESKKGAAEKAPGPLPEAGRNPERDEWRAQAREDVASLEAYVKAKKAQLREADFRLQVTKAHLVDLDRQQKRGVASTYIRSMGELMVVEAETDRETRLAELKAVETRRDRAMRRVALIDRGGVPGSVASDLTPSAERLAILERETDRLRYEMDRTDRALRTDTSVP